MSKLAELNSASDEQAVALLEPFIERAPEIARKVAAHRPFSSAAHLSRVISSKLLELRDADLIELFRAHPELAPDNPLSMTKESQSEQGRLNLTSGQSEIRARLDDLNARYREKFGFPFITALVRHESMSSVLSEFEASLAQDRQSEIGRAVEQVMAVSAARVRNAFDAAGAGQSG